MPGTEEFAKFVPGFDFLQNLMKGAGQSLPAMNQWIAPTLDPQEIERRIEQLRTVQFWLEQNAKLLATTIQALEVQRMTLATLKTMNMPMDSMREAFTMKPAAPPPASAPAPAPIPKPSRAQAAPAKPEAMTPSAPGVDPMQWWGALTQQFTELAANAMRETSAEAAKTFGAAAAAPAAKATAQPAATRKRKAPPAG